MKIKPNDPCPCCSKRPFLKCCRPWHQGKPAPTPEALMCSGFTAYAPGKVGYIIRTTHPQSPHAQTNQKAWWQDLKAFCQQTDFVGLQIVQVGEVQGNTGYVTFRNLLNKK